MWRATHMFSTSWNNKVTGQVCHFELAGSDSDEIVLRDQSSPLGQWPCHFSLWAYCISSCSPLTCGLQWTSCTACMMRMALLPNTCWIIHIGSTWVAPSFWQNVMQYTSCSGILWEMKNQQVLSTFPLLDTGRLLYEIDNNYFVFTITIKLDVIYYN